MNKVEIYYFSGTGNSLHVARELQRRLPGADLIPMVNLLDKEIIEIRGDSVGFVFPTYLSSVPIPVRQFLRKLNFKFDPYLFAITTRGGAPSFANINLEKILKKKGRKLDSFFILTMALNQPTGLKPSFIPSDKNWLNRITQDEIARLESVVQNRLDAIQKIIVSKEKVSEADTSRPLTSLLMAPADYASEHSNTQIHYYADSECTGCGICERVCLSHKIKMIHDKPEWQNDIKCYFCYACFNFCPGQSILIKNFRNSYSEKKGRYFHPKITAEDIAGQK